MATSPGVGPARRREFLLKLQCRNAARPFQRLTRSRPINQNSPHHSCGNGKEMSPAVPPVRRGFDKSHIRFIDQSRRLKSMLRPLIRHVALCQPVQFLVDDGHQLLEGAIVALAPGVKQLRDLWRRTHDGIRVGTIRVQPNTFAFSLRETLLPGGKNKFLIPCSLRERFPHLRMRQRRHGNSEERSPRHPGSAQAAEGGDRRVTVTWIDPFRGDSMLSLALPDTHGQKGQRWNWRKISRATSRQTTMPPKIAAATSHRLVVLMTSPA